MLLLSLSRIERREEMSFARSTPPGKKKSKGTIKLSTPVASTATAAATGSGSGTGSGTGTESTASPALVFSFGESLTPAAAAGVAGATSGATSAADDSQSRSFEFTPGVETPWSFATDSKSSLANTDGRSDGGSGGVTNPISFAAAGAGVTDTTAVATTAATSDSAPPLPTTPQPIDHDPIRSRKLLTAKLLRSYEQHLFTPELILVVVEYCEPELVLVIGSGTNILCYDLSALPPLPGKGSAAVTTTTTTTASDSSGGAETASSGDKKAVASSNAVALNPYRSIAVTESPCTVRCLTALPDNRIVTASSEQLCPLKVWESATITAANYRSGSSAGSGGGSGGSSTGTGIPISGSGEESESESHVSCKRAPESNLFPEHTLFGPAEGKTELMAGGRVVTSDGFSSYALESQYLQALLPVVDGRLKPRVGALKGAMVIAACYENGPKITRIIPAAAGFVCPPPPPPTSAEAAPFPMTENQCISRSTEACIDSEPVFSILSLHDDSLIGSLLTRAECVPDVTAIDPNGFRCTNANDTQAASEIINVAVTGRVVRHWVRSFTLAALRKTSPLASGGYFTVTAIPLIKIGTAAAADDEPLDPIVSILDVRDSVPVDVAWITWTAGSLTLDALTNTMGLPTVKLQFHMSGVQHMTVPILKNKPQAIAVTDTNTLLVLQNNMDRHELSIIGTSESQFAHLPRPTGIKVVTQPANSSFLDYNLGERSVSPHDGPFIIVVFSTAQHSVIEYSPAAGFALVATIPVVGGVSQPPKRNQLVPVQSPKHPLPKHLAAFVWR